MVRVLFFFNDTATTEIYTLSLHDALPICTRDLRPQPRDSRRQGRLPLYPGDDPDLPRGGADPEQRRDLFSSRRRSEEHTSELQSRQYLVCRLLLEKKKNYNLSPLLPLDII